MVGVEAAGPARGRTLVKAIAEIRSLVMVALPIGVLVAIFVVIDEVVRRVSNLGPSGYLQPSLLAELSRQTFLAVPLLAIAGVLVLWKNRTLGPQWPRFDRGWSLRLPVGTAIVLLTWWFSAYDYNLFLGQGHWSDRALLVVLGGLALWRPIFTVPWLLMVTTIMQQFYYPIGGYSVAEQFQLVRVVELFTASLVIRFGTGRWRNSDFVVAMLSLLASAFFVSGLEKVRLGWLEVGAHVEFNLLATYSNGWLGTLSNESISGVARALAPLRWPLAAGTLFVELGSALILLGKRFLIPRLVLFIGFHIGVVGLTGIFFWRWIIFELVLIAFLKRDRLIDSLPIFGWPNVVVGMALVLLGPFWARPPALSWLEAPINYVYRFEAIDAAGQSGFLPPTFFEPYDSQFTLTDFGYLSRDVRLPLVWGAIRERDLAIALNAANSTDDLWAVESTYGTVQWDADRAASFDHFMTEFVSNWNRDSQRSGLIGKIQPPPQLLTFGHSGYSGPGPIDSLVVWQVTSFWDGEQYQEARTEKIRVVEIHPS